MTRCLLLLAFTITVAISVAAEPAEARVVRTAPGPTYRMLAQFGTSFADGYIPSGPLLAARDGSLWGTTWMGALSDEPVCFLSCGTVFRLVPAPFGYTRQIVHIFSGLDGANPLGGLAQASDGTIYGTTSQGGAGGCGVIFAMNPTSLGFTLEYSFPPQPPQTGGCHPFTGPIVDGNLLLGTTAGGGETSTLQGTIYALNRSTLALSIVHWFNPPSGPDPAGEGTESGLLLATDGRLYGVTTVGGTTGLGEVFGTNPDGSGFSILHTFGGSDGAVPRGTLVQLGGTLYGVTGGGMGTGGTVFGIAPDGSNFRTLYAFQVESNPVSLTTAGGYLYGTTFMGGTAGKGSIFRMTTSGAFTTLRSLLGGPLDGAAPAVGAALTNMGNGYLAGTTVGGGPYLSDYSITYLFGCATTVCYQSNVPGGGTAFEIATSPAALPLGPVPLSGVR